MNRTPTLSAVMYGRFAHVTGLRMYVRWEWLPVQQTKWYRGERPVQLHRLAFVFEKDGMHLCVSIFREDGGFFHPSGPFRLPCFWAQPLCLAHCRLPV